MPGRTVSRTAGRLEKGRPRRWPLRFWSELRSESGEHDAFIKVVIVERLARAVVLVAAAISLLVVGRLGYLPSVIAEIQEQLNLAAGPGLLRNLIARALDYLGNYPHQTALALGVLIFALVEAVEALGLAAHRRWAEYLTVLATAALIPVEVEEIIRRPTLLRLGALLFNLAIVGWLAYRKRLFLDV
jgi:uncharacterized membrane protein (DUF2068 family)